VPLSDPISSLFRAGLVKVEDRDVPAGRGAGMRRGAPDAALRAGAGNDGGLVGYGHGFLQGVWSAL
jgi:hypothetical protein